MSLVEASPVVPGVKSQNRQRCFKNKPHTIVNHNSTSRILQLTVNTTLSRQHTHTRLTALFPGLPGLAGTRKVKPIWILLEQETVSGSGISWAVCKSATRSRQITTPVPHHSVFYRLDALPAAQATASKHWRQCTSNHIKNRNFHLAIGQTPA